MSFAHLHVHTEYSLLDGMSRISDLVARTVELGMDSVAITDHGAMYGVIEFYNACKGAGVKPIIGMETYLAARGMNDRDAKRDSQSYHLLLIAANQQGYKNLLKIASASQLDGFYYRPRIDKDFLAAHSEGLICTTGCLASEIPRMVVEGRDKEARRLLGWYQDVFGPDRFYVELQDHDIPDLRKLNQALLELSPYADIPLLATNDVHYVRRDDAGPHDVLLCIGTSSLISEPGRMKFSDDSYYLRSPQEMTAIFAEAPDAIHNTLKVAGMCEVNLDNTGPHLPQFAVPDGYDAQTYLRHRCEGGLQKRFGEKIESGPVRERLEHELALIHQMGFDNYFLIVWDLCEHAQAEDIWWNVRGSGAGSLVAYVLGITNIDPLENGLIFERFLNPGRVSMPDIDLDFPDDRRAQMIDYCVQRYGVDKVAQIITFGTLGARAALRDVARTMDIPLGEVDQLARLIPAVPGRSVSIEQALAEVPDLQAAYQDRNRPYIRDLIDTAGRLEGIARHASTHAAGVLIADQPLTEYTPLHRPTKGGEGGGDGLSVVSQWPMEIVESIGLLKVDFLGLSTLTIMRKACELIEQYHGIRYDLNTIPYKHRPDDEEHNRQLDQAFKLIAGGDTDGVFQVEGSGMTRMLVDMKPSRFEHIVAAISLFRPGPMEYIGPYIRRMHGEEAVAYHHPLLEPILAETYGICVYQEQIIRIASSLFGYSVGDADLMRRAVSKKKESDLKKHRSIFQKHGPEHGVSTEVAGRIFDDIEFFARYGFNKSHAADYAVLTIQTAFLKAHFPHEYMAALLTVVRDNTDKVGAYIADCRRMGIQLLPPHINFSSHDFTIEETPEGVRAIRYGLGAIKNVGEGAVETIVTVRETTPFSEIGDFCQRVDLRAVGKRALESLIKVGAFDDMMPRYQLLQSLERLMSFSGSAHRAAEAGQMSLFSAGVGVKLDSGSDSLVLESATNTEISRKEFLQWERELIGVYISEHPLNQLSKTLEKIVTAYSTQLSEADHGRQVTMAGIVTYVRRHTTRSGKPMAFAGVEDLLGKIEVVIWPSTWDETQGLWEPNRALLLRGKIDAEKGEPKLLCDMATTEFELYEAAGPTTSEGDLTATGSVFAYETAPDEWGAVPLQDADDFQVNVQSSPPPEMLTESAEIISGSPADQPTESDYVVEEPLPADLPQLEPVVDAIADPEIQDESVVDNNGKETDYRPTPNALSVPQRPETGSVHVQIRVRRSGDPEKDKRNLQRIHGALISQPGEDRFSLVIMDDQRTIEVEFPGETTHYGAPLVESLSKILPLDKEGTLQLADPGDKQVR